MSAGTNSWSDKLYGRLQAGETVRVAADEYRNAIDVETTAQWILDLAAARGATGIFHLGSNDALSRLEIARRLAAQWGYSPDSIVPAGAVEPDRAPRGRYHMLRPRRIAECSRVPVPTCREAIQRCVYAVA